jgi:hypothetical protein
VANEHSDDEEHSRETMTSGSSASKISSGQDQNERSGPLMKAFVCELDML